MQTKRDIINPQETQADAILEFYKQLDPAFELGEGIEIMNPFQNEDSWRVAELFYEKFYGDNYRRTFIFGINPGRFGGGITGIPFTDPIRLETDCGIQNNFRKQAELSSVFIYEVIRAYGGTEKFYRDFFITALSPLGFTKNKINLNYYDDKDLLKNSEAFIVECIRQQQQRIDASENCFCLGEGTNYKIFKKLNEKYGFFKVITSLPHPRWIMQYRRRKIADFTDHYLSKLAQACN
jgi:Uracil DNA glycosylase superfamily